MSAEVTDAAGGLGTWVRQWRHANRWTQERLAEAMGYDVSYVAKIERGRRPPSAQFVARLSEIAAAPRGELLQLVRRPSDRIRLPVPPLAAVGRAEEVARIGGLLLGSAACVTLAGAPGVGKTRLALEVAWDVAEEFRHGACFVSLSEAADAPSVAAAVVHELGLRERPGTGLEDLLVDALRHQTALLVLDNFEHVLEARRLVERLLGAAPHVRVLVTSREALDLDVETKVAVTSLRFPDPSAYAGEDVAEYPAVELFVNRARVADPAFRLDESNVGAVVDICARLDGLPLALSLTATAARLLSADDIATSLRTRLELPTARTRNGTVHAGLASALDWSWELLDPPEQRLLAGLGVFSGGFTLEAVESVCAEGVGDVLADLASLERKSLVEVVPGAGRRSRFRCLETIRRYAREKLIAQGRLQDVRRRHCSYFLNVAERAEPNLLGGDDQTLWLQLVEDDHANMATAFDVALAVDPDDALRLAAALWRWYSLDRVAEGRAKLELALGRTSGASAARVRCLNGFGVLARVQGDLDLADESFAEARGTAERLGAAIPEAFAVLNRGIVAEERGSYEFAAARFAEAHEMFRDAGDDRGVAHALNCLGVIAIRGDDLATASERCLVAMACFRSLCDRWSMAVTATNLGWIAESQEQFDEARDWYEESRQLWSEVGDERGLAMAAADLGRVARRQRQLSRARPLLEEALRVFHRLGDRRIAAACLLELADIATERRRGAVAARLLGAADGVRKSLGTPAWSDERAHEQLVLEELRRTMGEGAVHKAMEIGRGFSMEDVLDMIECDAWPPPARVRRGGRRL
ncbi:MAG TPA: tetratricopeptide repeat protein [Acidimicrobiales bacterium]|nr:tetratricopeptide repeat protein [Acidimicrobiales bacterium]